MSAITSVSLIGAGAIGSYYASKLFDLDRNCISLIAGGKRYDRLEKEGIIVNGRHFSIPLIRPGDEERSADLIIVAVKHDHLPDAIGDIKSSVKAKTIILSIMNGIDSEERIGAIYGMDKVLYGVAVGIDAVRIGNSVTYSKDGILFFGEGENAAPSERVREVKDLFDRAGIVSETPNDMIRTLWWKFMINVGINQTSAILGAPYGVFQQSPHARNLVDSAMREVTAIAAAADVHIDEDDVKQWNEILSGLSPEGKTSMLQDVEARRKTEVEMLAGTVIRLGRKYNIPTPVNETLFNFITVIQQSF
ncbi:MAG: ketopantoate reductase family protein [Deltaproteobacteria bacterium]|nr:ketopantoate reductase family protein [Deltaproteobacteria bacterium]MBN2845625.1 ketopantoate reductase family protein [Deltaproteobacteria bacterium]